MMLLEKIVDVLQNTTSGQLKLNRQQATGPEQDL